MHLIYIHNQILRVRILLSRGGGALCATTTSLSEPGRFIGAGGPSVLWSLSASMANIEVFRDCLTFAMDAVEINNVLAERQRGKYC